MSSRPALSSWEGPRALIQRSGRSTLRSTWVACGVDTRSSSAPMLRCISSEERIRARASRSGRLRSTFVVPWRMSPPSKACDSRSRRTATVLQAEKASMRMRSPLAVQMGSYDAAGLGRMYRVWATSASTSRPRASTSGWAANPEKNPGASAGPCGVSAGASSRASPASSSSEGAVNDLMRRGYCGGLTHSPGGRSERFHRGPGAAGRRRRLPARAPSGRAGAAGATGPARGRGPGPGRARRRAPGARRTGRCAWSGTPGSWCPRGGPGGSRWRPCARPAPPRG